MIYFQEFFEETDGTRLDQMTPSYGDWERLFTVAWPNLNKVTDNRLHRTLENPNIPGQCLNGSEHLLNTSLITARSYVVEAKIDNLGLQDIWGGVYQPTSKIRIGARGTTGPFNGYDVEFEQVSKEWKLGKWVAHSRVIVDSWTDNPFISGSRVVQLALKGHTVEAWVDGIKRMDFRDESTGTFDDIGRVMIRFDSSIHHPVTDQLSTKGLHLDSLVVHNDFPGHSISNTILLTGAGNSSQEVQLNWEL